MELLTGRNPAGRRLVPLPKEGTRVPGIDITASGSKGVSLAWAFGDTGTREAIEQAAMAATKAMITDLETQLPLARRGLGGTSKLNAKLAVSMFLHTTSRENDPQLHVHCVIANVCRGSDGRWSAVNSKLLHEWTPALGRVFRCHLARELQKRLGVELTRPVDEDGKQKSWFEIKGILQALIDQFSKRRKQNPEECWRRSRE